MNEAKKDDSDLTPLLCVARWIKEHAIFCALTLTGMMPLIIFMDTVMGILLFRDYGELKGMIFIFFVVFYAEFTKKYRDT